MKNHREKIHSIILTLTSDIKGANNYGLDCCWYNPKGKPLAAGITASYIAGSFDEVLRVIEKGAL